MSELAPFKQTAHDIAKAVNSGSLSLEAVVKFYRGRVESLSKDLNTHVSWNPDLIEQEVKTQTDRVKNARGDGHSLPLAGVPVAIKDNICSISEPATCGSKILAGFKSPYDATVISKLREAGAILFGKTNCDEFAMGSSNENSSYGPVKNPWDKTRVPGGSSGGSAAAVAADLAPLSLGSDTGGSIRQPASLCGIVGLKPTYGRVSRYGLIAYGSSLDQVGPFARDVKDAAILFDVLSGYDPKDSTSLNLPPAKTAAALEKLPPDALKGKRIGIVEEFFKDGLEPDVRSALEAAIETYRKLGAEVKKVSLPHLEYSIATYYIVATAEASANLARFDGVRYGYRSQSSGETLKDLYTSTRSEGFGREVKQRIMLGTFVLSSGYYDAYYAKANRVRKLIADDFAAAFKQVDLLVSPTSPTTAFGIGQKVDDPLAMYLSDICTIGVNLAGIPAISIPCGYDSKGLPVGMQLMGPHLAEETIFKGAYLYEQATQWHKQRQPKL